MKRGNKKGISPVVSTVLLIMVVIILAIIILLWSRGFIKEKILKFDKPIENVCSEVSIKTFVNDDYSFGVSNIGNVPIYAIDLKIMKKGGSKVYRIEESRGGKINVGLSNILEQENGDPFYINTAEDKEIKVIPILLGKNKDGAVKEYTCPEQTASVVWEE